MDKAQHEKIENTDENINEEFKKLKTKFKKLEDFTLEVLNDIQEEHIAIPIILTMIVGASWFSIMSHYDNFNFSNLILFLMPNLISLIQMPKYNKIINIIRYIILFILIVPFTILTSATLGNYIIDSGAVFSISTEAIALNSYKINKNILSGFLAFNIFIPSVTHTARCNKNKLLATKHGIEITKILNFKGDGEDE